jgi:NAD(P)H-hydrate epimerase
MGIPYEPGEALTCQQIRELDVLAIEHVGIPGMVLMENAGRAIAEFTHGTLVHPAAARVLILCGTGNNGGDGFVVARHLHNAGVRVAVVLAGAAEQVRGDAATNLRVLQRMGLRLIDGWTAAGLEEVRREAEQADVIVDALLGTGSHGAPRRVLIDLIRIANAAPRARRIAIDIPSGLDADSGQVHPACFRAEATVTMVAAKVGFAAPAAVPLVGRVVVVDIGVPRGLIPGRE